jgi:hypothetical protein
MTEWTVNNKLNAWYQKRYHIKLPKQYETKARLYFSTYSPISLFSAGEQGVWFDPSDVANLNWRRNLLTWTEQFDNAAWTKTRSSISANAAVAPDGTTTADKLVEDTTASNTHQIAGAIITLASASTNTVSIYVKAAERTWCRVANAGVVSGGAFVNLSTGQFGTIEAGVTASSILDVGNGWYRVSVTGVLAGTASQWAVQSSTGNGNTSYTGDGTSGILLWGAQLELGSVATDYQRITDLNTEVIERFPTATLYQDTAGTTPVTTTGQSVGLMLDKSKGLVLGPELVTNGTFDSAAGWSTGTGWTISGGVASFSNPTGTNLARTDLPSIPTGRLVKIEFDMTFTSGAGVVAGLNIGGGIDSFGTFNTSGRKTAYVTTTASRTGLNLTGIGNSVFSIDNISVKELAGNHAVQATTANRPIYGIHPVGGRRNLLERTEDFSNAYWTVGAQNLTAISSGRITPNTTLTQHRYDRATTIAAVPHTFSLEVKADGYNFVWLRLGTAISAVFNATTGAATGVAAGATASFTNAGDGYIRVSLSATTAGNDTLRINVLPTSTTADFAGDGTSGVLIRNAQLEAGSTASAYQRVTDQYNVTEAGVPSVSYLFFDGVNDSLATPTITPGVDKAQVFAGVRKLSDATVGAVVELSATTGSNNGSLILGAPGNNGGNSYSFTSKGTVSAFVLPTGFSAPITNVLTGIGDIAGDNVTLRANGTQAAQATTDQGTGNYLAYPLYIGARNSASLFFSGHLYSLVTRFGANLTADQIADTETWVAGETGFFAPVISGVPTVGVS